MQLSNYLISSRTCVPKVRVKEKPFCYVCINAHVANGELLRFASGRDRFAQRLQSR
jgi:hypothetical protein